MYGEASGRLGKWLKKAFVGLLEMGKVFRCGKIGGFLLLIPLKWLAQESLVLMQIW